MMYPDSVVLRICKRYLEEDISVGDLATMFEMTRAQIYNIFNGKYRRDTLGNELFQKVNTKYRAKKAKTVSPEVRQKIKQHTGSVRAAAGLYGVSRHTVRRIRND